MAGTIIDSLIVTLGLDASKFTQGQREAVDALRKTEAETNRTAGKIGEGQNRTATAIGRTGKAAAATTKAVTDGETRTAAAMARTGTQATRTAATLVARGREGAGFFRGLTEAALGFGAALAGVRTIQDALGTMTGVAALGRSAANAGIAPEKVSAFGLMVQRYAGGNASTASASLTGLVGNIEGGIVTGQMTPQMAVLSRLGVSLQTALHNPLTAMRQLAHVFSHVPKMQANAYGHILGLDQGTINLLEQGTAAFDKHMTAVKLSGVVTAGSVKEMEALQTALAGVDAAAKTLGRNLLTDLAPTLIRVANVVKDLETGNWQAINRDLAPPGHRTATGALKRVFTGSTKAEQAAARQAVSYFKSQGYTQAQAIGLAANIQAESSYNPHPPQTAFNKGHYGIAQWDATRRAQILAGTGIDVKTATYAQQLKAMAWELKHTQAPAGAALMKSRTAAGAAATVRQFYEKPGGKGPTADRPRMIIANRIQERLTGSTPLATLVNPAARVPAPNTLPPTVQAAANAAAARFKAAHVHANAAGTRYVPDLPQSVTALVSHLRSIQPHHTMNDNRSHTETHIGTVTVHTKATDPKGVAGAIKQIGTNANLASQANRGMM